MPGLDRNTGAVIGGWDHVVRSVVDILTTPIGSRVRRREYGSDLMQLVDQPMTDRTLLRLYGAVAVALARWEPRIDLQRVAFVQASADGKATLALFGDYLSRGHLGDRTTRQSLGPIQVTL